MYHRSDLLVEYMSEVLRNYMYHNIVENFEYDVETHMFGNWVTKSFLSLHLTHWDLMKDVWNWDRSLLI